MARNVGTLGVDFLGVSRAHRSPVPYSINFNYATCPDALITYVYHGVNVKFCIRCHLSFSLTRMARKRTPRGFANLTFRQWRATLCRIVVFVWPLTPELLTFPWGWGGDISPRYRRPFPHYPMASHSMVTDWLYLPPYFDNYQSVMSELIIFPPGHEKGRPPLGNTGQVIYLVSLVRHKLIQPNLERSQHQTCWRFTMRKECNSCGISINLLIRWFTHLAGLAQLE